MFAAFLVSLISVSQDFGIQNMNRCHGFQSKESTPNQLQFRRTLIDHREHDSECLQYNITVDLAVSDRVTAFP